MSNIISFEDEKKLYRVYSEYLRNKFHTKVYKLPISLNITCPNRDGSKAYGGCIFCTAEGGSFENLSNKLSVKEQIEQNKINITKNHKATKFIAYFQNFSNTYMPLDQFKENIMSAIQEDVVGINISTRPDLIFDDYMKFLKDVKDEYNLEITVELGLQSSNDETLKILNRCHNTKDYIDACETLSKYGLRKAAHLILDLPWDSVDDIYNDARLINMTKTDEVKLHSLYIMEGTKIAQMYKAHDFKLLNREDYVDRVEIFLTHIKDDIIIQRLVGRSDEEGTIHCNWGESWWRIKDSILEQMKRKSNYQGKYFKEDDFYG